MTPPAAAAAPFDGVLVGVPTYNEAANVGRLVRALRGHLPGALVMVIDDSSPDGTGRLVQVLAEQDPLVVLRSRPAKMGLGTAYLAAFAEGRRRRCSAVLTMDADFSHRPQDAPAVVRAVLSGSADLAIGSRYVPGGAIIGWPRARRLLSAEANRLIKSSLATDVMDCTGAFRAYGVGVLEKLPTTIRNRGYSALPELLLHAIVAGARITEVPITFVERERGATKLTRRELADSLVNLAWLRSRRKAAHRAAAERAAAGDG